MLTILGEKPVIPAEIVMASAVFVVLSMTISKDGLNND
jgi:hypothetical protein